MSEDKAAARPAPDSNAGRPAAEEPAPLDLAEKGRRAGQVISLDRRLFMKFTAFGRCLDPDAAAKALAHDGVQGALYVDANDPQGIGVMVASENPEYFVANLRTLFSRHPFADFVHKPEFDMLGRTYSIGYEQDLEETLFKRPLSKMLDPKNAWRFGTRCSARRSSTRCRPSISARSSPSTARSRTATRAMQTTCGSRAMGSTRATTTSSWD